MMNMPDAIPMFSLHFFKLLLLFRSKEGGDFGVGLRDTIHCTPSRVAMNRFHVGAGLFDQGSYLRHLFISQIQTGSQMIEHMAGHLLRIGQSHKRPPDHRGDQCAGDGAGEKNKHSVENDPGRA